MSVGYAMVSPYIEQSTTSDNFWINWTKGSDSYRLVFEVSASGLSIKVLKNDNVISHNG